MESRGSSSADALGLYLRLGYIPAPYALLRGSHLLPAGAWLEVDTARRLSEGRHFEFPLERDPDLFGAAADEAVDAAVRSAVRRHLIADVPVGTFLSGGIDSPLVAATMRAVSGEPVRAFTLGTGGDAFDESPDAGAYAAAIGAEHVIGHLTPERAVAMLDDAVEACAEPFADYSIFPTLFVSALARRHVKVALCGDGGDELFFGYAGRSSALLRLAGLAGDGGASPGSRSRWTRVLDAGRANPDPRWPATIGDLQRLHHTHGADSWLRRVMRDPPRWPPECTLFTYDTRDLDRTAQWLRWNEFVGYLGSLLQKVDRGSMFHSLEVRAPLLDREVIDTATRVHWRVCLDPDQRLGKLPLRRALARHVDCQTVGKRGFTVPMAAWLRGPLRPIFEEAVLTQDSVAGLELDRAGVRAMFERHLSQQANLGWNLWLLLSLALWERRHYRGRA